ncbi:BPI fold-containing family A member 1 [Sturnira hondurensis]|uniref:BPI fold-containing family A member 1 n=1 Tax=Sturnira hondurensis TaxID=192404 RepID=UPI0018798837|nr:BPI fold-containing family A member 1 [Sturnira hondurensis]
MFQIGSLIVLCGLLALPLPVDLASSPTNSTEELKDAVSNGLVSGGLLNSIKNLPLMDALRTGSNSDGLVGLLLQQLLNPLKGLTGIEITNPKLLEVSLTPSKDGHSLFINVPLGFDVDLQAPVVNLHLLKLSVKLNATVEVHPQKDKNGVHLVVGSCSQAPANLEVTLLDGTQTPLVQGLINELTDTLTKTIPKEVLGEVCSLVNQILSQLDVSLVQDIIDKLIPEKEADIVL